MMHFGITKMSIEGCVCLLNIIHTKRIKEITMSETYRPGFHTDAMSNYILHLQCQMNVRAFEIQSIKGVRAVR